MSGKDKPILVADDDKKVRSVLEGLLGFRGYKVSLHPNGLYLLETYLKEPDNVGLVMTDIKMPKVDGITDGITLGKNLRQNGYAGGILFMSGKPEYGEMILQIPEPRAFLEKPFGMQETLKAVERMYNG